MSTAVLVVRRSVGMRADVAHALCLASLAALGLILELFVVEEELLASGENEILAAVNALQGLILKLHVRSLSLHSPELLRRVLRVATGRGTNSIRMSVVGIAPGERVTGSCVHSPFHGQTVTGLSLVPCGPSCGSAYGPTPL